MCVCVCTCVRTHTCILKGKVELSHSWGFPSGRSRIKGQRKHSCWQEKGLHHLVRNILRVNQFSDDSLSCSRRVSGQGWMDIKLSGTGKCRDDLLKMSDRVRDEKEQSPSFSLISECGELT